MPDDWPAPRPDVNPDPSPDASRPSSATPAPARHHPHLTVIVVVFVNDECLAKCLTRLVPLTAGRNDVDIIVACDDRLANREHFVREYPQITWHYTPGHSHPAVRRARALRDARGSHVALTEDHCVPAPGWLDAALDACHSDTPIQGGPIDKSEPDTPLNWAGYFLEFTYYMPPISVAGDRTSDCNTTYARAVLDRVPDAWAHEFHETTVNWALRDLGYTIVRNPRQLVFESHPQRLVPALRERLAFGITYATTRSARLHRLQRLAYAAGTLLLPVVLTVRMASLAARRGRLGAFVRSLPWFLLLAGAWSIGELRGYLAPAHP